MSRPARTPHSVWWLTIAFVALVAAAAAWAVPREEADLATRVGSVIDAQDLAVEVAGRDITLSGRVAESGELERAIAAVSGIRGVRSVAYSGVTIDPSIIVPPQVQLTFGDSTVLGGTVPDLTIAAEILDAATARFGQVDSSLSVDPDVGSPTWLAAVPDLIATTEGWRSGTLAFEETGVVMTGVVDSDAIGAGIVAEMAARTRLDVDYSLDVVADRIPTLAAAYDGVRLTVAGELADGAPLDNAEVMAMAAYTDVDWRIATGPIAEAPWLVLFPVLLERLDTWTWWNLTITGGTGTLSGRGPSTSDVDQLTEAVLPATGIEWEDLDLQVSETALARELTAAAAGAINFATASAELDEQSRTVLDRIAVALLANSSASLIVEGHTDNQGGEAENLALSEARARSVVDHLVAAGVAAENLNAVGYGESRPITENGTLFGRAQNRRIEFVVAS